MPVPTVFRPHSVQSHCPCLCYGVFYMNVSSGCRTLITISFKCVCLLMLYMDWWQGYNSFRRISLLRVCWFSSILHRHPRIESVLALAPPPCGSQRSHCLTQGQSLLSVCVVHQAVYHMASSSRITEFPLHVSPVVILLNGGIDFVKSKHDEHFDRLECIDVFETACFTSSIYWSYAVCENTWMSSWFKKCQCVSD